MKNQYLLLTTLVILWIAITTAAGQTIPSYVPSNGLIGWWPFNGNANDESGNNNDGSNNGAILSTDRFGNADHAYSFDGLNSYISIPSSASLESPTTALTISAWINLAGVSLIGQTFDPILTKSNSSANSFMYSFVVNLDATGFFAASNNWFTYTEASYSFPLNQWFMVSVVLDSSVSYLYLNDSLVKEEAFTTNIQNNTLPLEIGKDVPGLTEIFNGKIDDIGIWNTALNHQEIINLYNAAFPAGIKNPAIETPLIIHPNPAFDFTTVVHMGESKSYTITIRNALGQKVFEEIVAGAGQPETKIDLSTFQKGLYFISINTSAGFETHPLVIQ